MRRYITRWLVRELSPPLLCVSFTIGSLSPSIFLFVSVSPCLSLCLSLSVSLCLSLSVCLSPCLSTRRQTGGDSCLLPNRRQLSPTGDTGGDSCLLFDCFCCRCVVESRILPHPDGSLQGSHGLRLVSCCGCCCCCCSRWCVMRLLWLGAASHCNDRCCCWCCWWCLLFVPLRAETGDTRLLSAVMYEATSRRDQFPALESLNFIKALARLSRSPSSCCSCCCCSCCCSCCCCSCCCSCCCCCCCGCCFLCCY